MRRVGLAVTAVLSGVPLAACTTPSPAGPGAQTRILRVVADGSAQTVRLDVGDRLLLVVGSRSAPAARTRDLRYPRTILSPAGSGPGRYAFLAKEPGVGDIVVQRVCFPLRGPEPNDSLPTAPLQCIPSGYGRPGPAGRPARAGEPTTRLPAAGQMPTVSYTVHLQVR